MKLLLTKSMLLAFPFLLSAWPAAAGVVEKFSPNGVFMYAIADTAFVGGITNTGPQGFGNGLAQPPVSTTVVVSSSLIPSSGVGVADGTLALTFSAGAAGVDDSFLFTYSGIASATSALASDGSPAAASVLLQGFAMFFIDANYGGVAPGSFVGNLVIDPMPAATIYEAFSLTIESNGLIVASYGPGDSGGSVALFADAPYMILGKYEMNVPYGIDPLFTLGMGGSLTPAIPEPRSLAMMLAGLVWVGLLARRRRRF